MNQQNLVYTLSHPQQRIWYAEMLHPGTGMWNNAGTLKIKGHLDFGLLETAINIVLRDNESIRIRIGQKDGVPYQYVAEYKPHAIDVLDFSDGGAPKLYEWDSRQTQTPMPLIDSSLFYIAFFRLGDGEGGIYAKFHHIISDALSIVAFSNQIMGIYQSLLSGGKPAPLSLYSYIDYLKDEHAYLASKRFVYDREYWTGLFNKLPEPTVIKQKKTNYYGIKARRLAYVIPDRLSSEIRDYCEKADITVYSLFLSALAIYINRITNKKDIVIGAPVANRTSKHYGDAFGMFVSTVPIRVHIQDELSFADFAQEVSNGWFSALKHQKYPFDQLMQDLRQTHKGLESLYDVTLSYQIGTFDKHAESFTYEGRWHFSGYQEPSLSIHVNDREDEGRFIVDYDYHTPFFSDKEIEYIHIHMQNIIGDAIAHPDKTLFRMELMADEERDRVLHRFNDTGCAFPGHETLVDLWQKRMAQMRGDEAAVVCRGEAVTYRQLDARSSALAKYLRDNGVGADDIVGLLVNRTMEYAVCVLAILKAGGAFLPIDAELPPERVAYILKDSGAKVLLMSPGLSNHPVNNYTDDGGLLVIPADMEPPAADAPEPVCRPNHLAYVIYTSGSTGQPKGVMIEHRSIVHFVYSLSRLWDFSPGARLLCAASISFDISVMELLLALLSGSVLVLAQEHEMNIPRSMVELIRTAKVNMLVVTPGRMELLLSDKQGAACLKDFREVGMGGDVLPEKLLSRVQQATDARITNFYGPTEITICCTCTDVTHAKVPNIGRPMHNVKAYILDTHRSPVPIGVPGELYIGGKGVARGYINKPELTAERFIDNPFRPGEKLYRTGDLVRWYPLGEIEFLGRIDQQVKIRGYRIELGEIENRLQQIPGIDACAVADREDADGRKFLCAYLVGRPPGKAEIKARLLRDLPGYMIPLYFMTVDSLPYNTSGKVDRSALPDPLAARETLVDDYAAPQTPTEIALAEIWSNALGLRTIGRNDNFFDIGGDSLSIVRVLAQVQMRFSVDLRLEDVNRTPYLIDLAEMIDAAEARAYRPIAPAPEAREYPVSSAQQRMWVLSRGQTAPVYNIPMAFVLKGMPDVHRLQRAFEKLIGHHDILRTRFALHHEALVQRVEKSVSFTLERMTCEPRRLHALLRSLVRPFDMDRAPLLRAALIEAGTRHVLFIDMHHSISDKRSEDVLMGELAALYEGKELPPPAVQYKDYAVWQRDALGDKAMEAQRAYWQSVLSGELPLLNLHTDRPRPARQRFDGARYAFEIGSATADKLRAFASRHGGTMYMAMLAVYNVLLSRYTGQEDIIVGTPTLGRPRPEMQDMPGVFINTLPLRNYPRGGDSFVQFFEELCRNVFAALSSGDYPFERVIADLKLPRDLSRNPLFDTMLTYTKGGFTPPLPGARIIPFDPGVSKLDLTLDIYDQGKVYCQFEYSTRLFKKTTIRRMAGHFARLAELFAEEPETRVGDAAMMSQDELWQVTQGFNQTDWPLMRERTVQSVFEYMAAQYGDKAAVIADGRELTFSGLNARANRFARRLKDMGVGRGTVVALCMRRCTDLMAALLGVLKAGGAYLPLDPFYPADRLAFMLADSGAKALLTDGSADAPFDGETLYAQDVPDSGPYDNLPPVDRPEDPAYLIYTSGSTGAPKGTLLPRRGLLNLYEGSKRTIGFDPDQTSVSVTTVAFDIFIGDALLPMLSGGTVVLCTEEELRQAHLLAALIEAHDVKYIQTTPTRMRIMMESAAFRAAAGRHIKKIVLGGEMIPVSLLKLLRKHIDARIINGYGPSEATVYASFKDLTRAASVTIGRPVINTRMYILDAHNRPVPPGVPGELFISGAGVAEGYINRESLTRGRFLPDPFWPGRTMYQTGDVCVFREDGDIEMNGRVDHQVKIRGLRIELGEIEAAMREVRGVGEAVVKDWGEGAGKYLCAYYTSNGDAGEETLRSHLSGKLPVYMVPSFFVKLGAFPTTPNGKVDRRALGEPDRTRVARPSAAAAGMSRDEKRMARIWSQILKTDGIGPDANFFALGGDSLGVIKVQAAGLQYGWAIRTTDFYEQQTLHRICAHIGAGGAKQPDAQTRRLEKMRDVPVPDYPHLAPARFRNVLLTGATGYLGAQMLSELAGRPGVRIRCLVRGNDTVAAGHRLRETLARYFGACPDITKKTSVVCGDITKAHLGLDDAGWAALADVDTVIHCAAVTDHVGRRDMFDSVNVGGTENVIALARETGAALLHISTASVSGTAYGKDPSRSGEFDERCYYVGQNYADNEYVRSKLLAEGAVLRAMAGGLNARIFRVGMLTATTDGRFQLRPEKNAFANRLKAIAWLGCVPIGLLDARVDITPADICAQAIIKLALMPDAFTPIYHMCNVHMLTVGEIVGLMEQNGERIRVISDQEFMREMKQLSKQGRLELLTGLMEELNPRRQSRRITVTARITERALHAAGFEWPVIDAPYMRRFMQAIDSRHAEGGIGEP